MDRSIAESLLAGHTRKIHEKSRRVPEASGQAAPAICPVCPHFCNLEEGELGFCKARMAEGGQVHDANYGRITSIALDPIEKKPLARFHPGSQILSVGSYGCNMRCPFCQNASIADAGPHDMPWRLMTPQKLVDLAMEAQGRGNIGIAFTYNEPLVGYEFVRDTGMMAHEYGLLNVIVSNGMVNPAPLAELLPVVDAANIDLKGFTQDFYDVVDGNLECVKRTIATLAGAGCHVEVTTLIVPGLNDDPAQIEAAAEWLASLDGEVVYHISRFFPCHRLADCAATPVQTVYDLADIARRHLPHVYTGNC